MKNYVKSIILKKLHAPERIVEICQAVQEESLCNKTLFITGGTSGIGLATAAKCALSGARVLISGRDKRKMDMALDYLGSSVSGIIYDNADIQGIECMLDETEDKLGAPIDCLVVNAGIYTRNLLDITETEYDCIMDVNLKGSFFLISSLLRRWSEREQRGVIVATGSNRGIFPDIGPYGLSKIALHSLIQGVAREYGSYGIRANVVAPGMTATNINGIDPSGTLFTGNEKAYRAIRPEEIAEVVCFLLSERASCINGAIIPCDLGDSLR